MIILSLQCLNQNDPPEIERKVIDKLKQTYGSKFANKDFAYDGENSHTKPRRRQAYDVKAFKVELNFAIKILMFSIAKISKSFVQALALLRVVYR